MAVATWRAAIVVGASSGIGEAVARRLALGGCRVALVARRAERLKEIVASLEEATEIGRATCRAHDVRAGADVAALWESIERELGTVDLLVYAAGIMPAVGPSEYTFEKDREVVEVNLLGAMAWMDQAAVRMEAAGRGTIVGISSVSGDRGRRGCPAYGAAKAGLTTFLESLRNRLACRGVNVVTVRPGYVDTPMTAGLALPRRLVVSADEAARLVLRHARRWCADAYVPGRWRLVMFVVRHIPSFLFRRMPF